MTKRPIDRILSMSDLKQAAEHLGNHFFDAGALRFFSSRVSETIYRVDDSRGYFVTSEKYEDAYDSHNDGPREYSVRSYEVREAYYRPHGAEILEILTASEFQQFATSDEAHEYAKRLQGYAMLDINSFELTR